MSEIPVTPSVERAREGFHAQTVHRVREAVAKHDIVIVGMGWNPHVRWARQAIVAAGHANLVHYIEIGNYVSRWRERLAVKLWARWPLFPMVFVRGTLLGGNARVRKALTDGTFDRLLTEPRAWPAEEAA
ncbi:MAG: glutaredoxin [Myxococcota bacterium]